MSSRHYEEHHLSWILPTALILLAGFLGIFGFCEWFVRRRRRGHDDGPSTVG